MARLLVALSVLLLTLFGAGRQIDLLAHGPADADHADGHEAVPSPAALQAGKDWIEEKRGGFLPLASRFTDEEGRDVALGEIIDRSTLLLPIYFYCPSACSTELATLAASLRQLKAVPGKDYRVIAYSFNEKETPADAVRAKKNYLKLLDASFPATEWRYLTGSREAIRAVTDAIGFRFQRMADGTYIHPSVLVAVGGDGKIIRYVFGSFIPGDIDMALADAAKGTPSLSVKRLLAMCFNTDPNANKSVFQRVKVGVFIAFFVTIAAVLFHFRKRGRGLRERGSRQE